MVILGIFCAGNLGREIYDIAERVNEKNKYWSEIVFVDNYAKNDTYYNVPVFSLENLMEESNSLEFVIANGEPATREKIFNQLKEAECKITRLIDPTAIISPTAILGEGVIITPFTSISSNVEIADNVLIQSYIRVGHDIKIGKNSVISANTSIGGGTVIGESAFIGMGAAIREELSLGNRTILAMGAALFTDLPDEMTAVGNPARIVRRNENGTVFQK